MPTREVVDDFRNTPFGLAIYQTTEVTNMNGRAPERVLSRNVRRSFEENGRDIEVMRGFPTVSIPSSVSVCVEGEGGFEQFEDYLYNEAPFVAADSNILIMESDGGGCGYPEGNVAVGPGAKITSDPGYVRAGPTPFEGNIFALMHEIGHNMGWAHDPAPGIGWIDDDGVSHYTPTMPNDSVNMCGDTTPNITDPRQFELWYAQCTFEHMLIRDKPLLDPPEIQIVDIEKPNAVVGDTASFPVVISNETDQTLSGTFDVIVNGQTVDTLNLEGIEPDQPNRDQTVHTSPIQIQQQMEVAVGGVTRTFSFSQPGGGGHVIEIVGINGPADTSIPAGETAHFEVSYENNSDRTVSETFDVLVNGDIVDTISLTDVDPDQPNRPPRTVLTSRLTLHEDMDVTVGGFTEHFTFPPGDGGTPGAGGGVPTEALAVGGGALLLFLVARPEN